MLTRFVGQDISVTISQLMLLVFVAILPCIGGCGEDDNPILEDEHDHAHEADAPLHADADGFNLEVNGKVVYHQHQGAHEGGLTVGVGEEIEVHAVFIDANEAELHLDEVAPPPGEDGHEDDEHDHGGLESFSLGLTGYDSSIIDIHLHEDEEEGEEHDPEDDDHEGEEHDHEGEEELHFEVVGLKAGKTEIKLQLLHGDHPDFTAALLIPVTVQ
jgi:hypothetical protein